jgi:hypothetical protein
VSSLDLPTPIFGYISLWRLVGAVFGVWLASWISFPSIEPQVSLQFDLLLHVFSYLFPSIVFVCYFDIRLK